MRKCSLSLFADREKQGIESCAAGHFTASRKQPTAKRLICCRKRPKKVMEGCFCMDDTAANQRQGGSL